jgi:predicted nucleic acid-binding protein
MRVVFDANVVAAGVCWHGEGRLCLVRMARHEAIAYVTETTLAETRETAARLIQKYKPPHNTASL